MLNTKLPFLPEPQKNNFSQPKFLEKPSRDCGYAGCPIDRLIPTKYGEIIPEDMYNPELFHMSAPMDNGMTHFVVKDEEGNEVITFEDKECGDIYDNVGDDDVIESEYPYMSYIAIPEDMEGVDNALVLIDENKGGIYEMKFESEEVPTAKDFSYQSGSVDPPEGDWDFIARIFFKNQLLEINDHLDNRGKASTMQIFRKDGSMID